MILKRILLASLLKPANDTRLYEKIGRSLAKLPQIEVHMVGYSVSQRLEPEGNLHFHPIFSFKRLSLGRLTAQKKYLDLLHQLSPDVLIVATHELLLLSWWYARQHKVKLVYDIQENYALNLQTQHVYPKLVAGSMSYLIRKLETGLARSVDHFFLAEASYAQELTFLANRFTILENKFVAPSNGKVLAKSFPICLVGAQPLKLLYSGTISELYGVMEAIQFTVEIKQIVPSAQLTIIGYAADATFLKKVKARIASLPYITLIGGDNLVPHSQILAQEESHHIGLLPYHPHHSTQTCVPTKLFEYQAKGLVVVTQKNPLWEKILQQNQSGLGLDFSKPLSSDWVQAFLTQPFYLKGIPGNVFWEKEEELVQGIIHKLTGI